MVRGRGTGKKMPFSSRFRRPNRAEKLCDDEADGEELWSEREITKSQKSNNKKANRLFTL